MERTKRVLLLLVAVATAVTASAQLKINYGKGSPLYKLQHAETAINILYVDSVNEEKLVEDAIRGMIEKLDPHSSYVTAKDMKAQAESLRGDFEGIGVQFNIVDDTLLVIQPTTNGPSEKVGIMAGDRIVMVDDTVIAGVKMPKEKIMSRLRGPKNTKVRLGVVRRGVKDLLHFTVTRDKIPVVSLDAAYIIRPGIGFIRISSFGAQTYNEVMKAAADLKAQGMKDLILDLQDNGGGYMQAATRLVNEFLDNGDLIVYTQGRMTPRSEYRADGKGTMRDGRIVVLLNEYSASASEITAGAIQDNDRGMVVGRRSFGKGLVQRPIDFEDGSELRLTVAHYYTPSGRCIQKPYTKGAKSEYSKDIEERYKHGEMTSADSIHFDDSQKFYTVKNHRVVYGGGGIMPDFFVPLDTTRYTDYHRKIAAKGIIVNANLKYVDANRKKLLKQYPTFEAFNQGYEVPDSYLNSIYEEAKKEGIEAKEINEKEQTDKTMRTQLKALVARNLWDMTQYFQVYNETSDIVMKAVELLQND